MDTLKNLPEALLSVSLKLADAKKVEAEAKLSRERTYSQLDTLIRNSGDKKPAETAISTAIKGHPEMEAAEIALVNASYEVDKLRAERDYLLVQKDVLLALHKE
jgi:hypothetical protein